MEPVSPFGLGMVVCSVHATINGQNRRGHSRPHSHCGRWHGEDLVCPYSNCCRWHGEDLALHAHTVVDAWGSTLTLRSMAWREDLVSRCG